MIALCPNSNEGVSSQELYYDCVAEQTAYVNMMFQCNGFGSIA